MLRDLPRRLRTVAGALLVAGFAGLLLAVVGLVQPAFLLAMVDAFGTGAGTVPWPYFGLLAVAVLLTAALAAVQQEHLARMQVVLSTLGHARFLRHLLRLPAGFFAQRGLADLTRRMQSNAMIAEVLSRDVVAVLINTVVVLTYAAVLLAASASLGLGKPRQVRGRIPAVFVGIHLGFGWGFLRETFRQLVKR